MGNASGAVREREENREPSKRELQRQMAQTRESLAETVDEIKDTIEQEVGAVKKTVVGVLDYREEFQKEPLVWSLGALSAGFALGYTVGYAHKNTKGGKKTPVIAFADSMVEEMSTLGKGLVMPALDAKIKELFGFEFSDLLAQVGSGTKKPTSRKITKRATSKTTKKHAAKKKRP
jgi:hypothetical protein